MAVLPDVCSLGLEVAAPLRIARYAFRATLTVHLEGLDAKAGMGGRQRVIVSIQIAGKPLVEVQRGIDWTWDDQALLVDRHHVDAIRRLPKAFPVGLCNAAYDTSGPVDAQGAVTAILR